MKIFNLPPTLQHGVARGTAKRAVRFARPYRARLTLFFTVTVLDALVSSSVPLLFGLIVDAIFAKNHGRIVGLAVALAGIVVVDQILGVTNAFLSARIGQGIIFDLRSKVYQHIQRLPLAFFTRTPTGALMSRLDNDVAGAQQAFTDLTSTVLSGLLTVVASFVVMFVLAWQFALLTLVALPVGAFVARFAQTRVAGLSRANLQALSNMSSHMSERFNVGGALLVTLFGRRREEAQKFDELSGEVRDVQVKMAVYARSFSAVLLVVSGLVTAVIFGWGGVLAVDGTIKAGTVVALATYLGRIYGPLISLGGVPIDVVNALGGLRAALRGAGPAHRAQGAVRRRRHPRRPGHRPGRRRGLHVSRARGLLDPVARERQRARDRAVGAGALRRVVPDRAGTAGRVAGPHRARARPR